MNGNVEKTKEIVSFEKKNEWKSVEEKKKKNYFYSTVFYIQYVRIHTSYIMYYL